MDAKRFRALRVQIEKDVLQKRREYELAMKHLENRGAELSKSEAALASFDEFLSNVEGGATIAPEKSEAPASAPTLTPTGSWSSLVRAALQKLPIEFSSVEVIERVFALAPERVDNKSNRATIASTLKQLVGRGYIERTATGTGSKPGRYRKLLVAPPQPVSKKAAIVNTKKYGRTAAKIAKAASPSPQSMGEGKPE